MLLAPDLGPGGNALQQAIRDYVEAVLTRE